MLVELAVTLLELPTVDGLSAAHDRRPDAARNLVVVRATDANGAQGWGECSALNRPTYTHEWAEGAFEILTSGDEPDPATSPMAAAALEMAVLDLDLRQRGLSLAAHLGVTATSVPAGAVLGLSTDVARGLEQAGRLVEAGYHRLKLKAVPGQLDLATAVRRDHPDVELQIDGNESFDASHIDALLDVIDTAELDAIEQPFAADDIDAAATLVSATEIPVMADEAIGALDDAEQLFDHDALSGVVVKPPKIGGIGAATELVDWAMTVGLPAVAGGMLECGLGRHALAAVAGLDGFTVTGDLSPARRWLADDPWPDLSFHDGHIEVPSAPGVAPLPDDELVERYAVRQAVTEVEISSPT